jgi:hypothetical protein
MRSFLLVLIPLAELGVSPAVSQNTKLPIQQAVEAQFPLTKPTADHKDMVTAGAVIDLLKDNLEMNSVDAPSECKDTYKGGKFEVAFTCKVGKMKMPFGMPKNASNGKNRTFVAG